MIEKTDKGKHTILHFYAWVRGTQKPCKFIFNYKNNTTGL